MSTNGFCASCGAAARSGAPACNACGSRTEGFLENSSSSPAASGHCQYRLTWHEFYLLENLLRRCDGTAEHLASAIRHRLATARLISEAEAGPELVMVDKWVVYRPEGSDIRTRLLVSSHQNGNAALQLRLDTLHGLALLGLRVGMKVLFATPTVRPNASMSYRCTRRARPPVMEVRSRPRSVRPSRTPGTFCRKPYPMM